MIPTYEGHAAPACPSAFSKTGCFPWRKLVYFFRKNKGGVVIGSVLLWQHQFAGKDGKPKILSIHQGDLCLAEENYDVVVRSAFKGQCCRSSCMIIR